MTESEKEVLGGLLIVCAMASYKKLIAGIDFAASGKYQDYPPGVMESGVAKDALKMFLNDIVRFAELNL